MNKTLLLVNNPVSRFIIREVANKKTESGKYLLEELYKCYFTHTVSKDLKCFLNYKTRSFNFIMDTIARTQGIGEYHKKVATKEIESISDGGSPVWLKGVSSVLRSIGEYGVRKPFVSSSPFLVVWNFTNSCNLKCKHCYQDAGAKGEELTLKEKFDVVDQLVDAGCFLLAFSGGEPLTSKDFYKVAKYAYKRGLNLRLATNGTLITKEVAKKLLKAGVGYAEISLDGAKKKTHENLRGVKGIFERTVQGIKNCVEAGMLVCVSPTLNMNNYKEIDDIVKLSKKMGVGYVIVFNFVPAGRGKENVKMDLSPKIRYKVLRKLAKESLKGDQQNLLVLTTAPQFACVARDVAAESGINNIIPASHVGMFKTVGNVKASTAELIDFIGGCGAGRLYMGLDPNGDIKPCVFMDIVAGNTKKDKIKNVWKNSDIFKALRSREELKENCGTCKDKYICGGCRARAWGYYRDLNAPDPGCMHNIKFWNQLKQ